MGNLGDRIDADMGLHAKEILVAFPSSVTSGNVTTHLPYRTTFDRR